MVGAQTMTFFSKTMNCFKSQYKVVIILLTMLVLSTATSAQNYHTIFLKIKDRKTNTGISNVNVIVKNNFIGTSTTKDGLCKIITYSLPISLSISHVSYKAKTIIIEEEYKQDTITVYLSPKQYSLKQIEIVDKKVSTFKQPKYSIVDFVFRGDSLLILEYYKSNRKNYRLILTDSDFNILQTTTLPRHIRPRSLKTDCLGYSHLLAKDSAYQIEHKNGSIKLYYPIEVSRFHELLDDCLFSKDSLIFFQEKSLNNYSHRFFTINPQTKKKNLFISSSDFDRVHKLMDELAFYREHPPRCQLEFAYRFEKEIMLPPFEQQLLSFNDSIYYFNHQNSSIDVYSNDCKQIRSTDIYYHLSMGWSSEILLDKKLNKVYTIIKETIYEIDLNTGGISPLTKHFLTEKIQINNGNAFVLNKRLHTNFSETYIEKIKLQ